MDTTNAVRVTAAQVAGIEPPLTAARPLKSRIFPLAKYTQAALIVSIGGFNFGFDTGSIGPITVMSQFNDCFGNLSPTMHGLLVSTILITASVSSFFAGPLADRISRTYTISLGGIIFAIGSTLACAATSLPMAFVARCISGIGGGLHLGTITVYSCEIAPTAMRGRMGSFLQFYTSLGIVLGYFTCYGTVRIPGSAAWRIPFAVQILVAIILAVCTPLLPHSPRWLRHRNRHDEAAAAWAKLGMNAAEAEKEEEISQRQESQKLSLRKQFGLLWECNVRGRTLLTCFINAMNQASGIDAVLYYAPILFTQAGLSSQTATFLASGASSLLILVCTTIAQVYADTWGRRRSTLCGGVGIAFCMLTMGSIYASDAHKAKGGQYAIIGLIYIFIIIFCLAWVIPNRIYCSEIHPMRTRAAATSLGVCINAIVNWLIAFSTPLFISKSTSGPYFLFGGCAVATVLVCSAFQVESKGHSLEEIDGLFQVTPWKKALQNFQNRRAEHISMQAMPARLQSQTL